MTSDKEPTPAEIELEDSLRSIRGVGEDAGRGSSPYEEPTASADGDDAK